MDREKIKNLPGSFEETDQDDVISLCNLSTDHYEESECESFHDQDLNEDDSFEFSFNNLLNTHQNQANLVINNSDDVNFCGKIIGSNATKRQKDGLLKKSANLPPNGYRYYASNSNSRKHYALIGVAKIPVEMKLSDIKKRQSKGTRSPTPMFPVNSVGQLAVAGDMICGSGGKRSRWGLVQSLKCGSRWASVLAKTASGCFRLVRV